MNSEEKFKKTLEEMLHSKEFPFDEENWEKAREILDASKKVKRTLNPMALAAAFVVVALLGGLYMFMTPDAEQTTLKADAKTKSVQEVQELKTNSLASPIEENKTNTLAQESTQQRSSAIPETKNYKETTKNKNTSTAVSPSKNESIKTSATPQAEQPEQLVITGTTEEIQATELPLAETKLADKGKISVVLTRLTNTDKETNVNDLVENAVSKTSPEQPGNTSSDNTAAKNLSELETVSPMAEVPIILNENKTEAIAQETKEPVSENETNPAPLAVKALDSTKKVSEVSPDVLPADNDQGEIGKSKTELVRFSIEAGTSYLYGWKNGTNRDAKGFNPVIGINYFKNYTSRLSASAGLHYSSVSQLKYSSYTSKVTRLSFGEESTVSVYTPLKVHYLIMPLRLNYQLSPKNIVGIGANIAYLLNVQGEVETYTEKLNESYNSVITKTSGYGEGFQKYDVQLSAFYKRTIYSNLALNLELFYGLTDVKNNALFKSNVFERNSGLKLTLVYNFLKK